MIRIQHVLKNGTEVPDVAGHVVRMADNSELYQVIKCIERKEGQNEEGNQNPV